MKKLQTKLLWKKYFDILEKPHSMIEHVGDSLDMITIFNYCSKIENEIGWKHQYNFDDALKQTVTWYLDNQSWWEPLIDENTLQSSTLDY